MYGGRVAGPSSGSSWQIMLHIYFNLELGLAVTEINPKKQEIKNVGMACQKVCKQCRDNAWKQRSTYWQSPPSLHLFHIIDSILESCCLLMLCISIWVLHTAVKIFGAECKPKGSMPSTYWTPCHWKPSNGWLSGCTGIRWYAERISNVANSVPTPRHPGTWATLSTVVYLSEHTIGSIPYTRVINNKHNSLLSAYYLLSACFFPGIALG